MTRQDGPQESQRLLLAIMGDASRRDSFGGLPGYLLSSLREVARKERSGNVEVMPLTLDTSSLEYKIRRGLWAATPSLRRPWPRRGWQYHTNAASVAWRSTIPQVSHSDTIVSLFQLVPSAASHRARATLFYLDATLEQLWATYKISVDKKVADEALEREAEGYRSAQRILVKTPWAAESLETFYGIDRDRIVLSLPGNNLDPELLGAVEEQRSGASGLRLLFIGKDWRRKGLDVVVAAVDVLRREEYEVSVDVIGVDAPDVPPRWREYRWLAFHGFVDKTYDRAKFVNIVSRANCGILMSRAEAAGISLREYYALGLPVICSGSGGMIHIVREDASITVAPEVPSLIEAIRRLVTIPSELGRMSDSLKQNPVRTGWEGAASDILSELPGA